ncbi:presequence translocated-associated motor subunit PAM17 like protein [Zymoseptoria brevis]|uniref:Presequence translocated-associated motor subunit PAM17 n=1 Tax=Zymoseptoria brevis TaxID=1047168 RepID=A0A0F4GC41_9PEZI|nr:presequence translocated-associated motor subunit PAM17 like protein [Zymoseptoria brevis]
MASLLSSRVTCLRTVTTASRALSSSSHAPAVAAFSTSTCLRQPTSLNKHTSRPKIIAQLPTLRFVRNESTNATSSSPQTSPPTSTEPPEHILTWDRFFALRRKRRWINLGCSVVTAAGAVGVFAPMLAEQDFDTWGAQLSGLDPVIVLGISTFAIAAGGWLCGPSFGTAGFTLWAGQKGWTRLIAQKEKSFYARVKKYRADASSSSPQNPIPDYYGEKIGSVKDYRRWLKDQRAFNLKKNKNMI